MRNQRIKPPEAPLKVATPSPLAALVDALSAMAANRDVLTGVQAFYVWGGWQQFLEDLNMMLTEHLVVGIRSPWIRRVGLPVFMAHRNLDEAFQQPDEKARALKSIEILGQCQDEHVRAKCQNWIRETYNV